MDLSKLTDIEIALLAYAIEEHHDHARHRAEIKKGFFNESEKLNKKLGEEYHKRKLDWSMFYRE